MEQFKLEAVICCTHMNAGMWPLVRIIFAALIPGMSFTRSRVNQLSMSPG